MEGKAAHGSRPADGQDAILRLGRVLSRLEALDRALQARPPHPLVGTGSLHASIIEGGRELSSYPDRATLQMERRTLADRSRNRSRCTRCSRSSTRWRARIATFAATATAMFSRPAYEIAADHDLPQVLAAAVAAAGATDAHDGRQLLDRRGRARSRRHSVGAVRPGRRRAAFDGGIRQRRGRDPLPRRAGRAGSAVLLKKNGSGGRRRPRPGPHLRRAKVRGSRRVMLVATLSAARVSLDYASRRASITRFGAH